MTTLSKRLEGLADDAAGAQSAVDILFQLGRDFQKQIEGDGLTLIGHAQSLVQALTTKCVPNVDVLVDECSNVCEKVCEGVSKYKIIFLIQPNTHRPFLRCVNSSKLPVASTWLSPNR